MKKIILLGLVLLSVYGSSMGQSQKTDNPYYSRTDTTKLNVSDSEWKEILPPFLYAVAREAATERDRKSVV